MKVPNFKDNNVVSIGHNSNRSISQEAYQQLKDKLQSVLGMLTEADKKHAERYPGSAPEFGKYRRANPYEKQSFARDTETLLDKASGELRTAHYKLQESVEGDDE